MYQHLFGPVASRRLGRSLGVDLVPLKTCSFDCVFCQAGRTTLKTDVRRDYVPVDDVVRELSCWLDAGGSADRVTLSGSGEPTLHAGFGTVLEAVRNLCAIPTALLSNGSLLHLPEVREGAARADLVKASLSAWDEASFEAINRPWPGLSFARVLEGLRAFRAMYGGTLWLEVFVLAGVNDNESAMGRIAALADSIGPDRVHLNTVARPPAEKDARPVPYARLVRLAGRFSEPADVVVDVAESVHRAVAEAPQAAPRPLMPEPEA